MDIGLGGGAHGFGKDAREIERIAKAREERDVFHADNALLHQKDGVAHALLAQILRVSNAFFLFEERGEIFGIIADFARDDGKGEILIRVAFLRDGNNTGDRIVFLGFYGMQLGERIK